MKIAILGANGYIGQHLAQYLISKTSYEVYCYGFQETFKGAADVRYSSFDITKYEDLGFINSGFDYIYFFSGLTGTDVSIDRYKDFIGVNEIGLLHVLDHLKNVQQKPKIVFPSTRLVYKGVRDRPLSETAEKEFKTVYASSKYNGEIYLDMFRNLYGIPYSVFRICVPYGNLVASKLSYGTIGFILERAIKKEPITLFGDGNMKRTFTHIEDICRQIVEVAEMAASDGQCFNVDGETFSLLEIAHLFSEKYGVPVQLKEWPDKALKLESGDTIFDAGKIRSVMPHTLTHYLKEWINT